MRFDHEGRLWSVGVQAFVDRLRLHQDAAASARCPDPYAPPDGGRRRNRESCGRGRRRGGLPAQVECRQMMRAFARPGSRVPLHCSAVGKAILSGPLGQDAVQDPASARHAAPDVKTITSPSALRADLERVRAAGYAVDDEEHAVGLRCIAAPIFDRNRRRCRRISASGPMARIGEERMAQLGALVLEASRAISADMGAGPSRR